MTYRSLRHVAPTAAVPSLCKSRKIFKLKKVVDLFAERVVNTKIYKSLLFSIEVIDEIAGNMYVNQQQWRQALLGHSVCTYSYFTRSRIKSYLFFISTSIHYGTTHAHKNERGLNKSTKVFRNFYEQFLKFIPCLGELFFI